jgi:hypothetical protein
MMPIAAEEYESWRVALLTPLVEPVETLYSA